MIIIGITGSIGMGKSTIAGMLKFLCIPIFDADYEVKEIIENKEKRRGGRTRQETVGEGKHKIEEEDLRQTKGKG